MRLSMKKKKKKCMAPDPEKLELVPVLAILEHMHLIW